MPTKPKNQPKPKAPFVSEDSAECADHFSKLVESIPVNEVETLNADPAIVRVNIDRCVEAIRSHEEHIRKALPLLDMNRILELPSLALALSFVWNRIYKPASPQEISAKQATLRPARAQTLKYLEIAASLGLVPDGRVKKIREDQGPVDEAQDAIAIVALFDEYKAALANKHPFPAEMLAKLDEDGHWLLKQLLPAGTTREKTERSDDAILRDRLWTEMQHRYDDLYQAGVAVWGRRKVDQHIPALRSRAAAKPSAATNAGEKAPGDAPAAEKAPKMGGG